MKKEDFKKQLKKLKQYVALAVVGAKDYSAFNLELIKHLTQNVKIPGLYVTLNKPYNVLEKNFKKKGIDTKVIIFIDTVTKISGEAKKRKNCLFIGSPENLTDVSVAMDQAIRALPKEKFLFFDSLNTLLMYNDVSVVAKFIHFLAGKMRVWKVRGIIISLEKKTNRELIKELSQFCDISFGINKGGKK